MLTKTEFQNLLARGPLLLDGATGSNLQKMGMPRGCCTEEWILNHPEAILELQRRYAAAGSQIIYAPTFQAQPIPLSHVKLDRQTEAINAMLVALSRQVGDVLVANMALDSRNITDSMWIRTSAEELYVSGLYMPKFVIDGGAKQNHIDLVASFDNSESDTGAR